MTLLEIVIFFLIIWWPIFFILLPIGFRPITDEDNNTEFVKSAPTKPMVVTKFLIASFVSLLLTLIIWMLDHYKLFSIKKFLLQV